jgi:hypothetical protein
VPVFHCWTSLVMCGAAVPADHWHALVWCSGTGYLRVPRASGLLGSGCRAGRTGLFGRRPVGRNGRAGGWVRACSPCARVPCFGLSFVRVRGGRRDRRGCAYGLNFRAFVTGELLVSPGSYSPQLSTHGQHQVPSLALTRPLQCQFSHLPVQSKVTNLQRPPLSLSPGPLPPSLVPHSAPLTASGNSNHPCTSKNLFQQTPSSKTLPVLET